MKNLILLVLALGFQSAAYADKTEGSCVAEAANAVKAVYKVSDKQGKPQVEASFEKVAFDKNLNSQVEQYGVNLEVDGGSAVYQVQADSGCLITSLKLLQFD